ncbi:Hypothetical predicted protein [Paramuricea clavata]|uniref:Uncharacterized protein n=1 Tax=Paramuricea clavata TaxID=317549 RepID=A0A6S7I1W3_PARCT|nr:Hypothetical predicted protein [Paramuricea clavata]
MACLKKITLFCVLFPVLYAVFSQVTANAECFSDSQCFGYCCDRKYPDDNVCRFSCIGESCIINSDCAPGECCNSDDKCATDCDVVIEDLAGWIVAVIVIGVIVVIVIPIGVVVFCCCCAASVSTRSAHGGVIVSQPATTGTTVFSTQQQQQQQYPAQQGQPMAYFQNPQPYPNQSPPYQPQGMVYPTGQTEAR